MAGEANEETRILELIRQAILTGNAGDLSAVANGGWRTLAVDNIVLSGTTAPTNATVTSTSVNVRGAGLVTVYTDITGLTTGVTLTWRGGNSGFGMFKLRSITAVAGLQAFTIGDLATGASNENSGLARIDDLLVEAALAANTGAGTGVTTTIRTRFLTQP